MWSIIISHLRVYKRALLRRPRNQGAKLEHQPLTVTLSNTSEKWGDDILVAGLGDFFVQAAGIPGVPKTMRAVAILCACYSTRAFSSVADGLKISKPALTQHSNRLCEAGLLCRSPDPDSGRSVLMTTTPQGRRLLRKLAALLQQARS